MKERDRLFLNHILSAVAEIGSFTTAGQVGFMADRKTQSAVVRQLEIIGEAVKNLSKELTDSETSVPWRQIAGTRLLGGSAASSVSLSTRPSALHKGQVAGLVAPGSGRQAAQTAAAARQLRSCPKRQPERRGAPSHHQSAPAHHSITSAARISIGGGMVRPSACAVFRLTTSS